MNGYNATAVDHAAFVRCVSHDNSADGFTMTGTNVATVVVLTASALTTSVIDVIIDTDPTATHNTTEHQMVGLNLSYGNVVNGVSFTIYAMSPLRLTGTFNVDWTLI